MLNGLDLFSGIGGITLALREWVIPVAYCESERYAIGVLLSRMSEGKLPFAPIWDEVRTFQCARFRGLVDIVYGGFPCQDISIAGTGKGLEGERSGLFFEIVRIIGEVRPRFIFLENVPAIRTRGAGVVAKELARYGYDLRWQTLSAAEIGANHKRERWWLLAHANGTEQWRKEWESKVEAYAAANSIENGRGWRISTTGEETSRRPYATIKGCDWWKFEPDVGRVANGVPKRVDRIKCLGNAVVPAQATEAFKRLMGIKTDPRWRQG